MQVAEIHAKLAAKFADQVGPLSPANKDAFAVVKAESIVDVCRFCKEDPDLAMDSLMNLSSIDWPKRNQIEVVYHLFSYSKRHTFVLKVQLDRAAPALDSVESVWKSADWLEREQFDLMGVKFEGHPDLRRIMMPDDWVGNPLRKDYKEQGSWHAISTTRESPLDGFVRLDELKKSAAAATAAAAKKETLQ
jgi:NADH-quinone oxidoreductase subunit C